MMPYMLILLVRKNGYVPPDGPVRSLNPSLQPQVIGSAGYLTRKQQEKYNTDLRPDTLTYWMFYKSRLDKRPEIRDAGIEVVAPMDFFDI